MRNTSRSIWRRIASDGAAFSVEPRHLPAGSVAASIRSFLQALNWIVHKSASIAAADARAGSRSEISVAKRLAHAGTSRPKNEVFCLFADRESRVFGYSSRPAGRGTPAAQRPLHPPRRIGHIVLRRWQSARGIGFLNAPFPSPWHPEHGSTRRPMRLNLSLDAGGDPLDAGGDPLGVDSPAEKRLPGCRLRVTLVAWPLPSVPQPLGRSRLQRPCAPGRLNSGGSESSSRLQRLTSSSCARLRPRPRKGSLRDREAKTRSRHRQGDHGNGPRRARLQPLQRFDSSLNDIRHGSFISTHFP